MKNHEIAKIVCERLSENGNCDCRLTKRGYTINFNNLPIAIVCNQFLYVRWTLQGRALLDRPAVLPPYEGAKYHIRIKDLDHDEIWIPLIQETWKAIAGTIQIGKETADKQPPSRKQAPGVRHA